MKLSAINKSWQQLSLVQLLCAACLVSCVAALHIFPTSDDNVDYVVKRQGQFGRDCKLCFWTFDLESCTRCRSGKRHIVPYYTAKRDFYATRSHMSGSNMCGCCAITRLSNNYCCSVCKASKRGG
ncbi:hypothetical protein BsWGS_04734 [Bradybaena similaris]